MFLRKIFTIFILLTISFSSFSYDKVAIANEALEIIKKEGTILIDVRTVKEFNEMHFKGAKNIPLNTINLHLDNYNKEDTIVFYCRSGNRSGQATAFFKRQGFVNVFNGGGLKTLLQEKNKSQ